MERNGIFAVVVVDLVVVAVAVVAGGGGGGGFTDTNNPSNLYTWDLGTPGSLFLNSSQRRSLLLGFLGKTRFDFIIRETFHRGN